MHHRSMSNYSCVIVRQMYYKVLCLFISYVLVFVFAQPEDSIRLEADYDKYLPPTEGDNPLNLSILLTIIKVNIKEQAEEVGIQGFVTLQWRDTRVLGFKATASDGNTSFRVLNAREISRLWKPALTIYPSQDPELFNPLQSSLMIVHDDSSVMYEVSINLRLFCWMDFSSYPMDYHSCGWKISPEFLTADEVNFFWAESGVTGESDSLYPFYMEISQQGRELVHYKGAETYVLFLEANFTRDFTRHLLAVYMPSSLLVVVSWVSFLVKPETVPGRMVLLVTNLLSLITMFTSVRLTSPSSMKMQPMEMWILICIVFIFLALMEYGAILLLTRFEQSWNESRTPAGMKGDQAPGRTEKNVLVPSKEKGSTAAVNREGSSPRFENKMVQTSEEKEVAHRKFLRFKSKAFHEASKENSYGCYSRLGMFLATVRMSDRAATMDLCSLVAFPALFVLFSLIYWIAYVGYVRCSPA